MFKLLVLLFVIVICNGKYKKISEVFSWKQLSYDYNGIKYQHDTDVERSPDKIHFKQELNESDKFFIQYNNVPIGLEMHERRVFVTVPRRRYGIPSTLNYLDLHDKSPYLKPYPDPWMCHQITSVYRPRVDECQRLWMVDTGLLEVPGARKQVTPPAIVVFDLKTNQMLLRHELKSSVLVSERTSGGLTSITVDVSPSACDDAYAYINDLATEGMIVFSLKKRNTWRFDDSSFRHDEAAVNFTSAGHVIPWKDGLFSIALSKTEDGRRTAFFHPLASTHEFSIDTKYLKDETSALKDHVKDLGSRGVNTQSGSHGFHEPTGVIFFANVAQDAILCWNTKTELTPENIGVAVQDHRKLVYISDLKVKNDEVWALSNQIPRFVYSTLDVTEKNFFIMRAKVEDLIKGTPCYTK